MVLDGTKVEWGEDEGNEAQPYATRDALPRKHVKATFIASTFNALGGLIRDEHTEN